MWFFIVKYAESSSDFQLKVEGYSGEVMWIILFYVKIKKPAQPRVDQQH